MNVDVDDASVSMMTTASDELVEDFDVYPLNVFVVMHDALSRADENVMRHEIVRSARAYHSQ